jgi:hypothetical protein
MESYRSAPPSHTCKHCQNVVIDAVENYTTSFSLLLEYTSVNSFLQAYHDCRFIRLTLAQWEGNELNLAEKERNLKSISTPKTHQKILSWVYFRKRQFSHIQLYVFFRWDTRDAASRKTLGVVDFQWDINGQSRDPRPFLIHAEYGKSTSSLCALSQYTLLAIETTKRSHQFRPSQPVSFAVYTLASKNHNE